METLVGIVIGMLLVLMIYKVYEVSEGQKRTITSASDAQQNASLARWKAFQSMCRQPSPTSTASRGGS